MLYQTKLTENQTIELLMKYLIKLGWRIESHCLDQTRGIDIVASKNEETMLIEVKGARAGDYSPTKKRDYFDSGQIKTHFGKAIVKMMEERFKNTKSTLAIAHPDDENIRKAIGNLTPLLKGLDIKHFWVSENGEVKSD